MWPHNTRTLKEFFKYNILCFVSSCTAARSSLTLASAWFWGFLEKKRLNARGFAWELLRSGMLYSPGKSLKTRQVF